MSTRPTEQPTKETVRQARRTAAVVAQVWLAGGYAAAGWMGVLAVGVSGSLVVLLWGLAIIHGERRS